MEEKNKKVFRSSKDFIQRLKEFLMRKDRLIIFFLAGVLFLVIAIPVPEGDKDPEQETGETQGMLAQKTQQESDYALYLERKLSEVLSEVEGVGEVNVMITLQSSAEKVVEKDVESENEEIQEKDSQGGSRFTKNSVQSQTTVYNGGTKEGEASEPYITKELTPAIEGVVVIAQGGENAVTVRNITEAVQALFDIDTHKIKVMKRN